MNTELQLNIQAYLDNELSPAEARKVAGLISSELEAQELYRELKELKELVSANECAVTLNEPREFYFSQIQRRIASAQASPPQPRHTASWWLRFIAPFAGAAAVLTAVMTMLHNPGAKVPTVSRATDGGAMALATPVRSTLSEFENKSDEVSSITFRNETEGVTVVWLTGGNNE